MADYAGPMLNDIFDEPLVLADGTMLDLVHSHDASPEAASESGVQQYQREQTDALARLQEQVAKLLENQKPAYKKKSYRFITDKKTGKVVGLDEEIIG